MAVNVVYVFLSFIIMELAFARDDAGFDLKTHPKASLLPLDSCGLDRKRVWEGSHVKLDEFPWTALVESDKQSGINSICGGALINKRYVLTLARCVVESDYITLPTMVRIGENDLNSDQDCETDAFLGRQQCAPPPQELGIEEIIPHPQYIPRIGSKQHDIALIRLDGDVKLDTPYVKPICLPTMADVEIGKELLVAGWGRTHTGNTSQAKLKVEVPVVSIPECYKALAQFHLRIGEGHLCAGGVAGKDVCNGDSGMPLMDWTESMDGSRRYSVVGLVSYGYGCGRVGVPSVYTKVSHYVPWILENIQY